jgi:hypothetical protein
MMYGKPLAKSTHLSQEAKDHVSSSSLQFLAEVSLSDCWVPYLSPLTYRLARRSSPCACASCSNSSSCRPIPIGATSCGTTRHERYARGASLVHVQGSSTNALY